MSRVGATTPEAIRRRAAELYAANREQVFRQTDRWFTGLMVFQWLAGIAAAWWISPRTWVGATSQPHVHLFAAVVVGGVISGFPILLALTRPGETVTRHVIAIGQMLTSALLIHLSGGRIETHFHVFGSLAFLAAYRDWRVLVPATLVVAGDHFQRGIFWPQSVYGVLTTSGWRSLEHAGWVIFENVFLVMACTRSVAEMRRIAEHQAELEATSQELRCAVSEAQAANAAKSEFLAMISHEIRTPMNGIFGMTELALDAADERERREFLLRSQACATSLMAILNDLLDFARIEAGRVELNERAFDLRAVVDGVLDTLAVEADRRRIELIGFVDPSVAPLLTGDPDRLRQILINLAGNAVKFTERGEVEIRIEPSGAAGELLRGSVRDTGIGIPPTRQATIFEAFVQAHTDGRYRGTGLGLTISQRLVHLMGGAIGVESAVGSGSTFWFTARLPPVAAESPSDVPTVPEPMRLLLIEPNAAMARAVAATLAGAGCVASVVADWRAAAAIAARAALAGDAFDVAVLDLAVPAAPVADTGERLGVPTVVLTGLRPQAPPASVACETVSAVSKPVKQRQLLAAVTSAIEVTRRKAS